MLTACKKCSKCFRSYFILVVFFFNLYFWTIKNHVFEYFRLIALLKNSTRFRSSRERWRWCWGGCWISIIFFYFLFLGALPERYCHSVLAVANCYQFHVYQDHDKICIVYLCICKTSVYSWYSWLLQVIIREGWPRQIGWIFGKIPNGLQTPPHFRKIMLQFCL